MVLKLDALGLKIKLCVNLHGQYFNLIFFLGLRRNGNKLA